MRWSPEQWHPRNSSVAHVLVRPYSRPERVGNVFLPDAYALDFTWTLWECVRAGKGATDFLDGYELGEGDIIVTAKRIPVYVGSYTSEKLFVMDLEGCGLRTVIPNEWGQEDEHV